MGLSPQPLNLSQCFKDCKPGQIEGQWFHWVEFVFLVIHSTEHDYVVYWLLHEITLIWLLHINDILKKAHHFYKATLTTNQLVLLNTDVLHLHLGHLADAFIQSDLQ
jgi:hypothetical protein